MNFAPIASASDEPDAHEAQQYEDICRFFRAKGVPFLPIPRPREHACHAGGDSDEHRLAAATRRYIASRHMRQMRRRLLRAYLRDRAEDVHPNLSVEKDVATSLERALVRSRVGDLRRREAAAAGDCGADAAWIASGCYMSRLFDTPRATRVTPEVAEDVCRVYVLNALGRLRADHRALAIEYFRREGKLDASRAARLADLVAPCRVIETLVDIYSSAIRGQAP